MSQIIAQASYLACLAAFGALAFLVVVSKTRGLAWRALLTASVLTALWAASVWAGYLVDLTAYTEVVLGLEMARSLAWIWVLAVLTRLFEFPDRGLRLTVIVGSVGPVFVIVGSLIILKYFPFYIDGNSAFITLAAGRMIIAVTGLLLLENMYRNSNEDRRWAVKYLGLGVGLIFGYDLFYFAETLLFKRISVELYYARGFVSALAVPLLALSTTRSRYWDVNLHVSRNMVFHTAVLSAGGLYLIVMSAAGYYIRLAGGDVGSVFQITFLAMAAILLVVIFSSGTVRSGIRLFIAKNFFTSKYDYRQEWQRFISAVSDDTSGGALADRIARSIARIVDSTAAASWVAAGPKGDLEPASSWNFGESLQPLSLSTPFGLRMMEADGVLEIGSQIQTSDLPGWITRAREPWLVVPLCHRQSLVGCLILGKPRSPNRLDWEDRALLKTVADQAASYLAEDRQAAQLSDARRMEEFNQRFAFIAHDLKNVVNQLSIMVQNARQHGDNPEFQKDMVATTTASVERMKNLLATLMTRRENGEAVSTSKEPEKSFRPGGIVKQLVDELEIAAGAIELTVNTGEVVCDGDDHVLRSSLRHLVENAIEASGKEGQVTIVVDSNDNEVEIAISDSGPGMEPEFIRERYFRPFETTKEEGFGLGGYQVREQIRALGGDVVVNSEPGKGTRFDVRLPLAQERADGNGAEL